MAFSATQNPPGVWIDEITATGPISGTGTSTPAMIGTVAAVKAELASEPVVPVTSWTDFVNFFGDQDPAKSFDVRAQSIYDPSLTLPFAVRGFFQNGGTLAYIVPCAADNKKLGTGAADDPLVSLQAFTDVSMVCLPQVVDAAVQQSVISHCEKMGDRVAILDGAQDTTPIDAKGALQKQRSALTSANGFAALYWPWIQIPDPTKAPAPGQSAPPLTIAPSGHIAGLIARSDSQRGVHKAPANEPVAGAVGLAVNVNGAQHAILNNLNINVLRVFPGRSQPLVWGARTLTGGTAWMHLNVRRLMCFIEDSISLGTNWAVFEPNNMGLWKRLELAISEFLTRVWKSGALFGATPDEAFYVRIDEELNPPSTRALGQVFAEIGVVPVHPAEYVVFRVGMWDGGAQITET